MLGAAADHEVFDGHQAGLDGVGRIENPAVDECLGGSRQHRGRIEAVAEGGEDYYTKPGEKPGEWMGELAAELGGRLNKPERLTRPLLLCFDEGAYLDSASATHQGDDDRKLTAIRRHRGLAVAWNVQSPATLPEPYWRLATDVYCYQVPGFDDVRTLERRIGMDRGALEYVRHLERYRVVRLQRGRGAVPLWGQA